MSNENEDFVPSTPEEEAQLEKFKTEIAEHVRRAGDPRYRYFSKEAFYDALDRMRTPLANGRTRYQSSMLTPGEQALASEFETQIVRGFDSWVDRRQAPPDDPEKRMGILTRCRIGSWALALACRTRPIRPGSFERVCRDLGEVIGGITLTEKFCEVETERLRLELDHQRRENTVRDSEAQRAEAFAAVVKRLALADDLERREAERQGQAGSTP